MKKLTCARRAATSDCATWWSVGGAAQQLLGLEDQGKAAADVTAVKRDVALERQGARPQWPVVERLGLVVAMDRQSQRAGGILTEAGASAVQRARDLAAWVESPSVVSFSLLR